MATGMASTFSLHRPPLFIIGNPDDEDDRLLAAKIADETGTYTDAQWVSVDDLGRRFPHKIIPGITLAILSATLAKDHIRCRALADLLARQYRGLQFFRHYCVYRGTTLQELRQQPALAPIFENVMVRSADEHLPLVLDELRDFVKRVLPAQPQLQRPWLFLKQGLESVFGSCCIGLHLLLNWSFQLSLLAALVLAIVWWTGASPPWTVAPIALCALAAGYRLNFLQPSDLWPWLGRRWQLPRDLQAVFRQGSLFSLLPSGLVFWTAAVFAWLAYDEANMVLACSWLAAGVVGQTLLDWRCRIEFVRRSPFADAATRALESSGASGAPASQGSVVDLNAATLSLHSRIYSIVIFVAIALAVRICPPARLAKGLVVVLPGIEGREIGVTSFFARQLPPQTSQNK